MDKGEHQSLEQVQAFMAGNEGVDFKGRSRKEIYDWTQATLCWHSYASLGREDKGLVKRYVSKVTGLSRAQATRLVAQYVASGTVEVRRGRGKRFTETYLPADVVLLAEVDEAHETLSGPATPKLLYRGYYEFADARYERLAGISSAHIYNLRKLRSYRERVMVFSKTRPTATGIGVRRKPEPGGRPGYLRVDTVHQGDVRLPITHIM
jgi:hypothetical protein